MIFTRYLRGSFLVRKKKEASSTNSTVFYGWVVLQVPEKTVHSRKSNLTKILQYSTDGILTRCGTAPLIGLFSITLLCVFVCACFQRTGVGQYSIKFDGKIWSNENKAVIFRNLTSVKFGNYQYSTSRSFNLLCDSISFGEILH